MNNHLFLDFLKSLRPLIDEHPEPTAKLDALISDLSARTARVAARDADHDWVERKPSAKLFAEASKKAKTTLSKPTCKFYGCKKCGAISNRAYPHWFRDPKTAQWSMKKPACVVIVDT